ncbi:MAG TPA: kelch repeat-containing protein [Thermoleophilaceae bacterium]|nr:kelch repeat-containing protein [Thermoleophilaceae bacterium]
MRGLGRGLIAASVAALGSAGVVIAAGLDGDATRTDRWRPLQPAGLERTEVAAARIGRFIYVIGGFERGSAAGSTAVERYDIRRDRWSRVRPMPLGLNHSTATVHDGRLYVHGGYAGTGLSKPTAALLEYTPGRDRWRRLRASRTPRAAHAAAVIRDRLYVAGGSGASGSLRSLEVFDFERRRWRRGPGFPGPARNHTTGVASGGRFYVLAGRDSGNLTAAERYDPRRRRWERLPDLRVGRGGIAAVRLSNGRIVVFGGENLEPGGTTIAPVELYEPRRRRWRRLPNMRTPRHGLGGAALGNRVYAIEGGPQPGFNFSRTIEFLDVR